MDFIALYVTESFIEKEKRGNDSLKLHGSYAIFLAVILVSILQNCA